MFLAKSEQDEDDNMKMAKNQLNLQVYGRQNQPKIGQIWPKMSWNPALRP